MTTISKLPPELKLEIADYLSGPLSIEKLSDLSQVNRGWRQAVDHLIEKRVLPNAFTEMAKQSLGLEKTSLEICEIMHTFYLARQRKWIAPILQMTSIKFPTLFMEYGTYLSYTSTLYKDYDTALRIANDESMYTNPERARYAMKRSRLCILDKAFSRAFAMIKVVKDPSTRDYVAKQTAHAAAENRHFILARDLIALIQDPTIRTSIRDACLRMEKTPQRPFLPQKA